MSFFLKTITLSFLSILNFPQFFFTCRAIHKDCFVYQRFSEGHRENKHTIPIDHMTVSVYILHISAWIVNFLWISQSVNESSSPCKANFSDFSAFYQSSIVRCHCAFTVPTHIINAYEKTKWPQDCSLWNNGIVLFGPKRMRKSRL